MGDKEVTEFAISPREILINHFVDQLKSIGMESCIVIAHFNTFDGAGNKGVLVGEDILNAFRKSQKVLDKTLKEEAVIEHLKKNAG